MPKRMRLVFAAAAAGAMTAAGGVSGRIPAQAPAQSLAPAQPPVSAPLTQLSLWLDGFHLRDGRPAEQMRATHYCAQLTSDLIQCALFDGSGSDAKLIGVEYVVTESALVRLPEDERAMWHSHAYEVTSGMLYAPGLSAPEQHALMEKLVHTYGKTWHTWDTAESLPSGRPALMMAFTRDGQAHTGLTDARDKELGVVTEELRARRIDIRPPPLLPGVDRGEDGRSCSPEPAVKHAKK